MEITYGENRLIKVPLPLSEVAHDQSLSGKGTKSSKLKATLTITPTGSDDPTGVTGTISWDNDYIYVKTSAGWARTALTLMDPT